MMLLVEGDVAGFGFRSCATRFSPLRFDLCVLSVWHLTFSERYRTTKGREEGGTGRGYHVYAITKDKEQTELEKRGNKTQGRSCRHRPFIGQNWQQRQTR
ncbi:hypothetical protein DPX16_16907 [Anabarilius grahami]|uniref:Uncharacterized protein n=1 Tax=Anabarilius grahami TaxID=495550 RepID=A0A3N0YM98_ANAGA|nr:hypothetical protein DPX16_16907 [Anabarilius grahami]